MLNLEIYEKRNIISKDRFFEIVDDFLNIIRSIELKYDKYDIESFLCRLKEHIYMGRLLITTPMLLATQNMCTYSSCGSPDIDLNQSDSLIRETLTPIILKGAGLGFPLDNVENPIYKYNLLTDLFNEMEDKCARMAGMVTLNIHHKDIYDFITMKRYAAPERNKILTSVFITDEFMKQAMKNGDANYILDEISKSIEICSEPGILFADRIEYANSLIDYPIETMSPCAETAMSRGDENIFGYINLNEILNNNNEIDLYELETVIDDLIRMLDDVIDLCENPITKNKRRISMGFCGLADVFIKNNIAYGSTQSLEITHKITSYINFYAKKTSINLAT